MKRTALATAGGHLLPAFLVVCLLALICASAARAADKSANEGVLDWFRNNKPVKEEGYATRLLGDDAVKYVTRHLRTRSPHSSPRSFAHKAARLVAVPKSIAFAVSHK